VNIFYLGRHREDVRLRHLFISENYFSVAHSAITKSRAFSLPSLFSNLSLNAAYDKAPSDRGSKQI
jgi:hypothetical protein